MTACWHGNTIYGVDIIKRLNEKHKEGISNGIQLHIEEHLADCDHRRHHGCLYSLCVGTAYAETAPVSIGSDGYGTLKAAVEASNSGDVITLNESIDLTETVAIEGKRITIDLNTHNITGEISLAIKVR